MRRRPLHPVAAGASRLHKRAIAQVSVTNPGRGADRLPTAAEEQRLEGIVSKRIDAPYRSGQRQEWVKVNNGMAGSDRDR